MNSFIWGSAIVWLAGFDAIGIPFHTQVSALMKLFDSCMGVIVTAFADR